MKYFLLTPILFFLVLESFGQDAVVDRSLKTEVIKTINKQKTGSVQDVLTNLYRSGIDNLLGKEHKFSFSSSFYGIDSIFHAKKPIKIDYKAEKFLRDNAFDFSLKGDSSNKISTVGGGFTFTIINAKDVSFTKIKELTILKRLADLFETIRKDVNKTIMTNSPQKMQTIEDSWTAADAKHDYSGLDVMIKSELSSILADNAKITSLVQTFNAKHSDYIPLTDAELIDFIGGYVNKGKDPFHEEYMNITEKYARKPLLTFSPGFSYDRINKQGIYSFASDFTVGLGNDPAKKPWELEIKASFKIENDTANKKTNYNSKPFSISAALNKVLLQNDENESKMEFKFFTQYDYQFGKVATGVDRGLFTLNSTLRINVYKSLWLPVSLKYDPKNSNFFGIFAVTANLGN